MKTVVIITAFPLREGEDHEAVATAAGDAAIAAVGPRDGEGCQVLQVIDGDPKVAAKRAARAAR